MELTICSLEEHFYIDGYLESANHIASWNGNSWNILGTNSTSNGVGGIVYALAMNGTNNLFVGGSFGSVAGYSILANNIASWDGNSWNFLGTDSTNNGVNSGSPVVYALAMNGTNNLFVGGSFGSVAGYSISANNIASWNGNSWKILVTNSTNNGVNDQVYALAMNGTNNLFVEFVPNIFHEFPSQDAILLAEIEYPSTLVNEPPTTNKLFVPFIARAFT